MRLWKPGIVGDAGLSKECTEDRRDDNKSCERRDIDIIFPKRGEEMFLL